MVKGVVAFEDDCFDVLFVFEADGAGEFGYDELGECLNGLFVSGFKGGCAVGALEGLECFGQVVSSAWGDESAE